MVKEDFTIVEVVNIKSGKKKPMRKTTAESNFAKKKWKILRVLPQEEIDKMNGLTTSAGAPFVPEYKEVVVTTTPVEPVKAKVITEEKITIEPVETVEAPEEYELRTTKEQLDKLGIKYRSNTGIVKLKEKLTEAQDGTE